MNDFRKSFNTCLSDQIEKDFKPFSLGKGYELGLSYQLGVMYFNIMKYNQLFYSRTVKYNTGNKRHFNLKYNYYESGLGFGYHNKEGLSIIACGGIQSGNIVLTSYYEYSDGSKDIGASKILNGKYNCLVSMKPTAGIFVNIPFNDVISFYAEIDYVFDYNIRFKDGSLKFYMEDINKEKVMRGQLWEIPRDYVAFWNEGGTWLGYDSAYGNYYVEGDLSGLQINFGIKFSIPETSIY
ncbi:MAG: hypothetical protein Kow0068_02340 [Marinilabiliales bacterium]